MFKTIRNAINEINVAIYSIKRDIEIAREGAGPDTSEQDAIEFARWMTDHYNTRPVNYQIPNIFAVQS